MNCFSLSYAVSCLLHSGKDTDSSALEEEGDDLKALEAKIRCLGMKKKPSQGTYFIGGDINWTVNWAHMFLVL